MVFLGSEAAPRPHSREGGTPPPDPGASPHPAASAATRRQRRDRRDLHDLVNALPDTGQEEDPADLPEGVPLAVEDPQAPSPKPEDKLEHVAVLGVDGEAAPRQGLALRELPP